MYDSPMKGRGSQFISGLVVGVTLVLVLVGLVFLFSNHTFWHHGGESFSSLFHSQGHWQFELFVSLVETIILDVVVLYFGWQKVVKPHIHRDVDTARRAVEQHLEDDMDAVDKTKERHQG